MGGKPRSPGARSAGPPLCLPLKSKGQQGSNVSEEAWSDENWAPDRSAERRAASAAAAGWLRPVHHQRSPHTAQRRRCGLFQHPTWAEGQIAISVQEHLQGGEQAVRQVDSGKDGCMFELRRCNTAAGVATANQQRHD